MIVMDVCMERKSPLVRYERLEWKKKRVKWENGRDECECVDCGSGNYITRKRDTQKGGRSNVRCYIYIRMDGDGCSCVCVCVSTCQLTSMAQNEVVRTRPRANPSIWTTESTTTMRNIFWVWHGILLVGWSESTTGRTLEDITYQYEYRFPPPRSI